MNDYVWDVRKKYEVPMQESTINGKQKRAKNSEADQTRRGAIGTSIVANGKDALCIRVTNPAM